MSSEEPVITLSPRDYDAVLLDLDGVLTRTARVHAAAWKRLFDTFLEARARESGEAFVPFDIEDDYRRWVDGKPRADGIVSFLGARGIELPAGTPHDTPDAATVAALGRRKDEYFQQVLERDGVAIFEPSLAFVRAARSEGMRLAVVSSSRNCHRVLEKAGIADLFDVGIDGVEQERLGLAGKPAPDSFLEAAHRLGVQPARAVVVEDAEAGVAAGRAGGFGIVIGVDRGGRAGALETAGADVVVTSLAQVQISTEPPSAWRLVYEGFDPREERTREALCALGNGYFTTRGALVWARADGCHYPGTYLAGGYNRLRTEIAGRCVEHEDLVNLPNWLLIEFRIGDGDWFGLRHAKVLAWTQQLDLRHGTLERFMRVENEAGRRTVIGERRIVSMDDMHLCALELTLTPENWSGRMTVRSGIDGRIENKGARLYRHYNKSHLEILGSAPLNDDGVTMRARTKESRLVVAQAARTRIFLDGAALEPKRRLVRMPGFIAQEFEVELRPARALRMEKLARLYTSRDPAIFEPLHAAQVAMERTGPFEAVAAAHARVWAELWRRVDIGLRPAAQGFGGLNVPMLLRLNMFHLLQAVSFNSIGLDIGVPARGWTGEAYQGHIFWDELFIFPFLNFSAPEITRSLLMYRYRRLGEARAAASAAGLRGAMFPWQSASDGSERTQRYNLNPLSGRWIRDDTYLQRHVGSAIAFNVWQYFQVTGDIEFMSFYGAELILDIARFWSSIARLDESRGRYVIRGVVGPDEFHVRYPDADDPGLDNNAYTNVMAVWVLWRALEVLEILPDLRRGELRVRLGLTAEETARWEDITRRMFIPFHDNGIISQFEGYERLAELDWAAYRARYGNIQRLDLILESENDSAGRYRLSKQADVLMLFFLFSSDELRALFERLGYDFPGDTIPRNVAYYDSRSSHGSTLSRVVHAWVLARRHRERALGYFAEALQSDVGDIQEGTTAEGVHLGAMAGTVDLVHRVSTGIEWTGDVLRFNPLLPRELERLDLRIRYRGHTLDVKLTRDELTLRSREPGIAPIRVAVKDVVCDFPGGSTRIFRLNDGAAD